jgi:Fic/DOC family N-terminal
VSIGMMCCRNSIFATRSLDVSLSTTQAQDIAQKAGFGDMTHAGSWQPGRPYSDLRRLPPALDQETKPVLKQCVTARAALAELTQAAELIPDPAMLINTLPLLEARASSQIENIVTTADKLFRHPQADGCADPATKAALRYRRALLEGVRALKTRPLTTRTAESICRQLKGVEMTVRRVPGTALT